MAAAHFTGTGDKDVLIATLDTQGSLLVQEKGDDGRLLTLDVLKPGQVRW